ncbi:TRAP transporter substrate-binding protein [Marinobacterium aestuariivivens]|uniref:TRAP transporter substrate-binding protein n=1 Tax=Marinobacterium aestuariivivens TaxID=1698799 RepID=A0ABW2A279_9GAMM
MKTTIKKLLVSAVMTAGLVAGTSSADTIRLSTTVSDSSNWVKAANKFKELVEARSEGEHKVEVYANGTLVSGNDRVELEMAQAGAVDIIMKSTPWLSQLNPDFIVVSMPWIFPDTDAAMAVMDGPVGDKLSAKLESQGIRALAWGSGSFFQLYTNPGPIETVDDIAGVKIRTPGLELYLNSWSSIGSVPVAMSFAEVFSALQAGAIDGGISPIPLIYSSRFYEVSKNISMVNFSFEAIGMLASNVFWARLSDDDKALVAQAAKDAMIHQREVAASEETELARVMEASGVSIHTPSEEALAGFKAKVAPVYAEFKEKVGAELVSEVEAQVKALSH